MLKNLQDGRQVIDLDNKRRVTVTKADGTSLYITRDIAAGLHRIQSFKADKILYVVEHGQSNHFVNLFDILHRLEPTSSVKLKHVMFGRIQGMSTRKGTAVFLSDILNEAKDRTLVKMEQTNTTKVTQDLPETADKLAISAVLINDLKQKKTRNYEFSWEQALKTDGNSGIKLQYSHARLNNLILHNQKVLEFAHEVKNLNFELLNEPEAVTLVLTLAQFDEALARSYEDLEPSVLVKYLFHLCNDTSKAIKVLKVKDIDNEEKAVLRLTLFIVTKKVLAYGMSILGLQPLDKM